MRTIARLAAGLGCAVLAASCGSFGANADSPATADAAVDGEPPGAVADGGDASTDAPTPPTDASLGCPAGALLCDAFEDRANASDLKGKWQQLLSGAGSGRIDAADAFSPAHALAIDVPTGTWKETVGLLSVLPVTHTSVTLRAALRVSVLPAYAQIISMVADSAFFALVVDGGKVVAQYGNGTANGAWVRTTTDFPLDRWFRFAFVLTFGPSGGVELQIDGASVYKGSAATTSTATVQDFRLILQPTLGGLNLPAATTIHYDDVVLE